MRFNKAGQSDIEAVRSLFSRLDVEHEEDVRRFHAGILDVYPEALPEEEARELLGSFEAHNLRYEDRFVRTLASLFRENGMTAVAFLAHCNRDHGCDIGDGLKHLFSEKDEHAAIRIDNERALETVVKLSARELFFSNLFFVNLGAVVIGNYELGFPVYCVRKEDLDWIAEVAAVNGLHVRRR